MKPFCAPPGTKSAESFSPRGEAGVGVLLKRVTNTQGETAISIVGLSSMPSLGVGTHLSEFERMHLTENGRAQAIPSLASI